MKAPRLRTARRAVQRLGTPGLLGLAVAGVAAVFFIAVVVPARHRLEAAHGRVDALQTQVTPARGERHPPLRLADQLAAFYRIFPRETEAPRWIRAIAGVADRSGLPLQEVEYRTVRERDGKLVRLEMHVPLRGEYRQIRQFLAQLRAAVPVASLQQVEFERQKIGDPQIEADLTLVVFFGSAR